MTIPSNVTRNSYTGTGITGPYPVTFKFFEDADLKVTVADTNGVESVKTLTTDYTVTGAGEQAGGSITFTTSVANGYSIVIEPKADLTQDTDIKNEGGNLRESIEDRFDRLCRDDQVQQNLIDRAIKAQITDIGAVDPVLPPREAGALIGWNDSGTGFANRAASLFASDAAITATGSTTARWISDRFADAVNVKDYGAVGDGVIDDTAAINAAIVAALALPYEEKAVLWPAGVYNVSKIDLTDLDYVCFVALGTVQIVGIDDTAEFILGSTNYNVGSPGSSTVTRHFSMDGGNWLIGPAPGESYHHGLRLEHFVSGSFNRVSVSGTYATVTQGGLVSKKAGVYMQYCYVNTFNECSFAYPGTGVSNYAVFMDYDNCNLNRFVRCRLNGSHQADQIGFGIKGNGNAIVSCDVSAFGLAIDFSASRGLLVSGCYFEANSQTATCGIGAGIAQSAIFSGGYCEVLSNSTAFNVGINGGSRGTTIDGIYFSGEDSGTNRTAVDLSANAVGFRMSNCTFGTAPNGIDTTTTGTFNGNSGLQSSDILPANWISFPTTQIPSTDPNTLDDYEEGTWTPAGNGITLATASGRYTKIGDVVHAFFEIIFPATADAGNATISGLPFSAGSSFRNGAAMGFTTDGASSILAVNSTLQIYTFAGVLRTNAQCSTKQYYGSITYKVA